MNINKGCTSEMNKRRYSRRLLALATPSEAASGNIISRNVLACKVIIKVIHVNNRIQTSFLDQFHYIDIGYHKKYYKK